MIIAEISQNFTNLNEAKELIRLAKENGADLMKAQLFDSMALYGEHTPSELSFADARALVEYGEEIGTEVFFSVFDILRVKWCKELKRSLYKIAYSQRNNWDLIKTIPTSAGIFYSTDKFTINSSDCDFKRLYCIPHYPTNIEEINFNAFQHMQGLSDHTIGLDCAKIALAKGAQIIEKHFCLRHDLGIDAKWSMNPPELRELRRWADICKQVLN